VEQLSKGLALKSVSKTFFGTKGYFTAVEDVSLELNNGEFLVLLGPGRCGKTVLLNMIIGLELCTSGHILYNGQEKTGYHPDFGMVFQNIALMPYMTVMENVEVPLKIRGVKKVLRRDTAQYYIELVGLNGFEKSYPYQLSGGMKQRVGIARAYVANPKVLIMDEPFGQLDAQTRYSMQNEILRIWETEKRTVIFVTNNIEEACYLGDRIILLSDRPATVKETYNVDLDRPRDMLSNKFLLLRKKISDNTDLAI
jgi:ABC-type nitrate/sulfonate/bicarbonate transport system ATPase subunit